MRQLKASGFRRITMAVGHLAELIQAYFGDGQRWGLEIDYSREEQPLGTMGPLRLISDLPEHFLVMNGDVLTDLPFSQLYEMHCDTNAVFTVAAYHRTVNIDFGVLESNGANELTGFHEKPNYEFDVSMGVYIASRRVLDYIPDQEPFGFDDLMNLLIQRQEFPHVFKYTGYWLDIGRQDDCLRAVQEFPDLKDRLLPHLE